MVGRRVRVGAVLISVLAALGQAGCINLKAVSSGEIGCAEQDIEITDDSSGLGTRTWTAHCNGRTYYCSAASTGNDSGQYACTEANDSSDRVATADDAASPTSAPPAEPKKAESDPPEEALGFKLGGSSEESETACGDAGHTWTERDQAFICSGTAKPIGVDAQSRLAFCEDALCDLTVFVTFDPEEQTADDKLERVVKGMEKQYGKPKKKKRLGSASCISEGFVVCASTGAGGMIQEWEWTSGEKIYFQFKGKNGKGVLAVRYLTSAAVQQAEAEAEGIDASAF